MYAEGTEAGKFVVNLDPFINNAEYGLGKEAWLGDPALKQDEEPLDDFITAYVEGGQSFTREGTYTFPYMKSTEALLFNFDALTVIMSHYRPDFNGNKTKIQQYMDNLDWEEFMELCRQANLYKAEYADKKFKVPAFYDSDANLLISQLYQSKTGYSSINKTTGTGQIDFATGTARTSAEKLVNDLKGWYDEKLFTTRGAYSSYGSDSFKNKETIFTIGSTGGSGYSLTSSFEIGVAKVPSVDSTNPLYVCQGPDLCILNNPKISAKANADRVLYAWKLIKFLTNPDKNVSICVDGSEGYLPVRKSAYYTERYIQFLSLENEPNVKIANCVTEEIDGAYFSSPCFMGSADLRKETGGILSEVLLHASSEADVTTLFQTGIDNATMKIK